MKRITLSVLMLLATVLAACSPATASPVPTTVVDNTPTPIVMETAPPMETATTEATAEATDATTDSLTISTSSNTAVAEPFLVDNEGRTLYVFTQDAQNSGISNCTGDCILNWPAVVVTGMPVAGEGVDGAMLGTITRDDGTTQVTYNGWPLYYYTGDVVPGDIVGQGINDVWYLVSAMGTAIQQ